MSAAVAEPALPEQLFYSIFVRSSESDTFYCPRVFHFKIVLVSFYMHLYSYPTCIYKNTRCSNIYGDSEVKEKQTSLQ